MATRIKNWIDCLLTGHTYRIHFFHGSMARTPRKLNAYYVCEHCGRTEGVDNRLK